MLFCAQLVYKWRAYLHAARIRVDSTDDCSLSSVSSYAIVFKQRIVVVKNNAARMYDPHLHVILLAELP